jgi:hypothetical protein
VSVIVNTFTGQFEEVGSFGKPARYRSEQEAISIAAQAFSMNEQEKQGLHASLMFRPSEITHIRTYPFWKVTDDGRVV